MKNGSAIFYGVSLYGLIIMKLQESTMHVPIKRCKGWMEGQVERQMNILKAICPINWFIVGDIQTNKRVNVRTYNNST